MKKIAKLRLVMEPSAEKIDSLTAAVKRLAAVLDEINAKGALSIELNVSTKVDEAKDAA